MVGLTCVRRTLRGTDTLDGEERLGAMRFSLEGTMPTSLWRENWAALDARILGLMTAGQFLLHSADAVGSDYYGIINIEVIPNARGIFEELRALEARHATALPPAAASAIRLLISKHEKKFQTDSNTTGWSGLQGTLGVLASFRTEFNFLIADTQAVARAITLRGLIHLQRSIVADEDQRIRWKTAFARGETACEKLGATHLLGHGIWAFKASATGERTDLVLGEPLRITSDVENAAQALVLTEWKLVRAAGELEAQGRQALAQARRYSVGLLAGFELANTRFLVLVSDDHVQEPAPVSLDGVTYRYFNLAVDPSPPSRA